MTPCADSAFTGIITKPDTLTARSSSEAFYASLARNEEVEFRLGWHVLRNMDTEKGLATLEKRDAEEKKLFSEGIWQQLPGHILGIAELNSRLSKVLMNQIANELPNVIKEITSKLEHCQQQLDKLGQPRATPSEQRYYLLQISQSFQTLVKASVDGTYNDPFFEDPETDRGYQQRIRAVVQNLNRDFAKDISERGHYRKITSAMFADSDGGLEEGVIDISRDKFVDHIQELMRRTRGRELPCTFNPMIVANLFLEQCRPWGAILEAHVQSVWDAAKEFLELICVHVADNTACEYIISDIIEPALYDLMNSMKEKTQELLSPHQQGHPITYNQQFFEIFQKSRDNRRRDEIIEVLKTTFDISDETCNSAASYKFSVNFLQLVNSLAKRSEPDMDRFAASEALDCMEAYYEVSFHLPCAPVTEIRRIYVNDYETTNDSSTTQVALKRFLDDVAVEIVETKLIAALANILLPAAVFSMSDDVVERIAGESEDHKRQREKLKKQLEVLGKGSDFCKRFMGVRLGDGV